MTNISPTFYFPYSAIVSAFEKIRGGWYTSWFETHCLMHHGNFVHQPCIVDIETGYKVRVFAVFAVQSDWFAVV
jgi:hypothetical protein